MASPRTEQPRIGGAIPRFSWKPALVVLVILGVTGWSAAGVGFALVELVSSTGPTEGFGPGRLPPDPRVIPGVAGGGAAGVGFDLVEVVSSTGPIERFVSGMFPPDLSARTLATTGRGARATPDRRR